MAKHASKRIDLLGLPAEIRIIIYDFCLLESCKWLKKHNTFNPYDETIGTITSNDEKGLLATCRQVRTDCIARLFHCANVNFEIWIRKSRMNDRYRDWLALYGKTILPVVQSLTIGEWQHYYVECPARHPVPCECDMKIRLGEEWAVGYTAADWVCPEHEDEDGALQHVIEYMRTLEKKDGKYRLTMENLWEIFEAAASDWKEDGI